MMVTCKVQYVFIFLWATITPLCATRSIELESKNNDATVIELKKKILPNVHLSVESGQESGIGYIGLAVKQEEKIKIVTLHGYAPAGNWVIGEKKFSTDKNICFLCGYQNEGMDDLLNTFDIIVHLDNYQIIERWIERSSEKEICKKIASECCLQKVVWLDEHEYYTLPERVRKAFGNLVHPKSISGALSWALNTWLGL